MFATPPAAPLISLDEYVAAPYRYAALSSPRFRRRASSPYACHRSACAMPPLHHRRSCFAAYTHRTCTLVTYLFAVLLRVPRCQYRVH